MINRLSRKILGLDIRSDSVCAVVVKNTLKGPWLDYFKHIPIAPDSENPEDALGQALLSVTAEIDPKEVVCVASYAFDHLSFRNIRVPFREKKKIRQVLPFEMETLLPFSPKDLVTDFLITENQDESTGAELITATVRQEKIEKCLSALQAVGLDPDWLSINGLAAACLMSRQGKGRAGNRVVIDTDGNRATAYFTLSGEIKAIRRFSISGDGENRASGIARHLRLTLPGFEVQNAPAGDPWQVVMTGSGTGEASLTSQPATRLDMQVAPLELAQAFSALLLNPPDKSVFPAHMNNALALCLMEIDGDRPINFRQGRFAPKNFWVEYKAEIIRSSVFAAVVLLLFFAGYVAEIQSLNAKVESLDQQIEALFTATLPDVKMVDGRQVNQMEKLLEDKKKPMLFEDEAVSDIRTIDIINDISRLIPKNLDVVVAKLVISPGSVIVSGTTDTFNSVDDMKSRLEKGERFLSVTITSANLDRSGKRVDYKLKIQTG